MYDAQQCGVFWSDEKRFFWLNINSVAFGIDFHLQYMNIFRSVARFKISLLSISEQICLDYHQSQSVLKYLYMQRVSNSTYVSSKMKRNTQTMCGLICMKHLRSTYSKNPVYTDNFEKSFVIVRNTILKLKQQSIHLYWRLNCKLWIVCKNLSIPSSDPTELERQTYNWFSVYKKNSMPKTN